MQKIIAHPTLGKVLYVKSARNKTIRASVNSKGEIRVSFPCFLQYETARRFVEDNLEKILLFAGRAREKALKQPPYTAQELREIRMRAHEILPERLAFNARKLNDTIKVRNRFGFTVSSPFSYNRLFIKNNRSNWGSCSSKKNINLNMHLVNLPQELCDYIIIHELCHLVYPNHGEKFHALVNLACGGKEKEYSRTLRKYSSLLKRVSS